MFIITLNIHTNSKEHILLEKLTVAQLVKFPVFYGSPKFIFVFTARQRVPFLNYVSAVHALTIYFHFYSTLPSTRISSKLSFLFRFSD